MCAPCGVEKFPEAFFSSESSAEPFPVRGEKGRGKILPNLLKPRFSQNLSRLIEAFFLVFAGQNFFEIVSAKRLIPQKIRPVCRGARHVWMLPLIGTSFKLVYHAASVLIPDILQKPLRRNLAAEALLPGQLVDLAGAGSAPPEKQSQTIPLESGEDIFSG